MMNSVRHFSSIFFHCEFLVLAVPEKSEMAICSHSRHFVICIFGNFFISIFVNT